MAAKQPWVCKGCQPNDQVKIVKVLLSHGANLNRLSNHGNTILMDIAGGGNVHMFKWFYDNLKNGHVKMNLEQRNNDGRNLYDYVWKKVERGGINWNIKKMVRSLVQEGLMRGRGLATQSSARNTKRIRRRERAWRECHPEDNEELPKRRRAILIPRRSPSRPRAESRKIRHSDSRPRGANRRRRRSDSRPRVDKPSPTSPSPTDRVAYPMSSSSSSPERFGNRAYMSRSPERGITPMPASSSSTVRVDNPTPSDAGFTFGARDVREIATAVRVDNPMRRSAERAYGYRRKGRR